MHQKPLLDRLTATFADKWKSGFLEEVLYRFTKCIFHCEFNEYN